MPSISITSMRQLWYLNSRLIINRVKGPLHRAGLPPPRPALVRQQIEADEGIRTVFGEGYQVTEGTVQNCLTHMFPSTCLGLLLHVGDSTEARGSE